MNKAINNVVHIQTITVFFIIIFTIFIIPGLAYSDSAKKSPHYTKVGFFDIHVCNWPGRDLFFMSLFSTTQFGDIKSIEVFYPDGKLLSNLDKSRYKLIEKKGKPEKRVFISQSDIGDNATNGWYTAKITMNDGNIHHSRDYVELSKLPVVSNTQPVDSDSPVPMINSLSWQPVSDDAYYMVFIRDVWDDQKLIYTSKISKRNSIKIPEGLLAAGGNYRWIVHARNVNEHKLYGDFNHGSISRSMEFSIED